MLNAFSSLKSLNVRKPMSNLFCNLSSKPLQVVPAGITIQVGFHMTSLKFTLKKLSILPRFYFHDALEQLKTNFHTNFRFKRVLGFVIEYT